MKHFGLKFNHGVEIGAYHAYVGHYKRTQNKDIKEIACDELGHRWRLEAMLLNYDEKPSVAIDLFFTAVGMSIQFMCSFCPLSMLNLVARTMEAFAVINYANLAVRYPHYRASLMEMADMELAHEKYFNGDRKCLAQSA